MKDLGKKKLPYKNIHRSISTSVKNILVKKNFTFMSFMSSKELSAIGMWTTPPKFSAIVSLSYSTIFNKGNSLNI